MKILVVGGGAFGKEHLKTLQAIGGTQVAVSEPREAERAHLRDRFALADAGADPLALIERFGPDGVVIATPAATHAALAIAALARDIPVLVEKPVTPDAVSLRALCDAATQSRAFLQPGHILRFSAAHRQLRQLLLDGEIGDLLYFRSRRYRDDSHAARYTDIDPVLMTLIHDIDLALWFDGGSAVCARATRRPEGTSRSLTIAELQGSTGAVWQLSTAWLHPGRDCPPDRVELIGTRGSAELEVGRPIELHAESHRSIPVEGNDDPLRTELECFLAGIRAGASRAPVSLQDALNGLLAAEMILEALGAR